MNTNTTHCVISDILQSDPFDIIMKNLDCDDILSMRWVSKSFYTFIDSKLGTIVNSLIDNPQI
ncbi:unnamed protein product, partial [marine sediment metagenome]